jgi:hypothetical protein
MAFQQGTIHFVEPFSPHVWHVAVIKRLRQPAAHVEPVDFKLHTKFCSYLCGMLFHIDQAIATGYAKLNDADFAMSQGFGKCRGVIHTKTVLRTRYRVKFKSCRITEPAQLAQEVAQDHHPQWQGMKGYSGEEIYQ